MVNPPLLERDSLLQTLLCCTEPPPTAHIWHCDCITLNLLEACGLHPYVLVSVYVSMAWIPAAITVPKLVHMKLEEVNFADLFCSPVHRRLLKLHSKRITESQGSICGTNVSISTFSSVGNDRLFVEWEIQDYTHQLVSRIRTPM